MQLGNGLVGEVTAIDDCFITVNSEGTKGKYAKSAVCKVLKTELKVGERVKTTSGIVGKIEDVSDSQVVTISSGGTKLEIDRKAICEVLPAPAAVVVK